MQQHVEHWGLAVLAFAGEHGWKAAVVVVGLGLLVRITSALLATLERSDITIRVRSADRQR